MLDIRLSGRSTSGDVLALAVIAEPEPALIPSGYPDDEDLAAHLDAFRTDSAHTGRAGSVQTWSRPLQTPRRILLVGVGSGDEAGWRTAGAALARACSQDTALTIALPIGVSEGVVRAVAEGLWLAAYTFRLNRRRTQPIARIARGERDSGPDAEGTTGPDEEQRVITLLVDDPDGRIDALADARTVAVATRFARDLTNMPSEDKTPEWFAGQVERVAAGNEDLRVRVRAGDELVSGGFGGIVAVGSGSTRGPRLVELSWQPPGATRHVVLVGKGITFDTGGICIKPREGMKLMRKDMGGAAAIIAATFGAAEMDLPVRVTAIVPLAENMASGTAFRPGDVVRHYGGATSEIRNTDAEGRVVLADALAYAVETLAPDVLVDLATLTGANLVALGRRTGALYSDNDELADALAAAASAAGERVWRMPLHDEYLRDIRGDSTDLLNASETGGGSIMAALYLREFTGEARSRWAHIDMSAPSWAEGPDAELVKGATGWGVRTLLRWLEALV